MINIFVHFFKLCSKQCCLVVFAGILNSRKAKRRCCTGAQGELCPSKTLGQGDGFWVLVHSSYLKAKGMYFVWTMSTTVSTRLCALGRLGWHLWKNYSSSHALSTALCQLSHRTLNFCIMENILPILHAGNLRLTGFIGCPSLYSQQGTEPGFKFSSLSLKAQALSTLSPSCHSVTRQDSRYARRIQSVQQRNAFATRKWLRYSY